MKLNQAAIIELESFERYLNANSDEVPYAIINMLNIIMTQNDDKKWEKKLKYAIQTQNIKNLISSIKIDKRCIYDLRELNDLRMGIGYVNGHHLSTKATQAGLMKNIDCMFLVKLIFF